MAFPAFGATEKVILFVAAMATRMAKEGCLCAWRVSQFNNYTNNTESADLARLADMIDSKRVIIFMPIQLLPARTSRGVFALLGGIG